MAILIFSFLLFQEQVVFKDRLFFVLLDIIVPLERCFRHSTSVQWGHGAVKVDWRLKQSASRALEVGTAWLGLQRHQADATLDTTVLKVNKYKLKARKEKLLVFFLSDSESF